jgi:hypothetical protein
VASLDRSVDVGAARRYGFVGNAGIGKMPTELRAEGRGVVGLESLNGRWKMLADFLKEIDRCLGVVAIADAQDAKSGRLIHGCELIKALTRSTYKGNKSYIGLHGAAWYLEGYICQLVLNAILL